MKRNFKDQIILLYLNKAKTAVRENNVVFVRRSENLDTLWTLNLTVNDVKNCILGLSIEDYYKGPEMDHDLSEGQIWVFRHPIKSIPIYIKLKLFEHNGKNCVKILSFHTSNK